MLRGLPHTCRFKADETQRMKTTESPNTTDVNSAAGALRGVRVLDMSRILAGPWASQTLADLGADVIKVESRAGDDTRRWGPPFMRDGNGEATDAAYFSTCNRNKKSITVNFSCAEGAELIRQLVNHCDILIENYKLGGLEKYALDYTSLKKINPRLIYCSITGFGQSGPYARRAGYDFLIQGMGGLMSITGQPDGSAGAEPVKVGVAITDLFTGMYAATSILSALIHRDNTGQGQHIDCSLLDCQIAMLANQAASALNSDAVPTRMGNNHPNIVPYRAYAAKDGHVIITCGNNDQFQRLCRAIGLAELATDPRFAENSDRVKHRTLVDQLLQNGIAEFERAELIKLLEHASVPCGPINTVNEVFADPHVQARDITVSNTRSDGTNIHGVAYPVKLSATPASYRHAPPALGSDTDAVLQELLNLDPMQIHQLRDQQII